MHLFYDVQGPSVAISQLEKGAGGENSGHYSAVQKAWSCVFSPHGIGHMLRPSFKECWWMSSPGLSLIKHAVHLCDMLPKLGNSKE